MRESRSRRVVRALIVLALRVPSEVQSLAVRLISLVGIITCVTWWLTIRALRRMSHRRTELLIELYRMMMEITGSTGLIPQFSEGAFFGGALEQAYRGAMVTTFGGGVNEVQRDIIAMAGLWLPRVKRRQS